MNCSFSYQRNFFYYYFTRNQKKTFCVPTVGNIFLFIFCVIITERFNIHLEATRSFLLGCAPNFINTPLLYCWHWVKSFLKFPATLFHNFQKIFQTLDREQWKLILTYFNLENILSSFALETGTMNNNLWLLIVRALTFSS